MSKIVLLRDLAPGKLWHVMDRKLILLLAVGLALLLAGCAGRDNAQPASSPTPASSAPTALPASASPARPVVTVTPTPPPPASTASQATAAPGITESVVRSGRLVSAADVRAAPDGAVVGQLPAGALAIVTGSRGDWLEIISGDAPDGHGWIPQSMVSFAQLQPAVGSSQPAVELTPTGLPELAEPAAPTPAVAAARPSVALSGKLVFQDSNGGNIYAMNADGSGLRRLTYGFDPALSPDGSQVAFTRWDEPRGLWVIGIDGANERHLFTANRPRSPTWTPDGAAIILERNTSDRSCRLSPFGCLSDEELFNLFGGQSCLTTPFGTICISDFDLTTRYATALTRYELASAAVRDLPTSESATAPRHTPGGATVIYLDKEGLELAQATGDGAPQRLVPVPPLVAPAAYSPDGQFIYAARNAGNRWDLWRWRSDGSQPTALTVPDPLAARAANNVAPVASPDGRSVIFLTDRSGPWQLWVMNSDGSNPRPLAPQALAGISFSYDFNSDRVVDWGPRP